MHYADALACLLFAGIIFLVAYLDDREEKKKQKNQSLKKIHNKYHELIGWIVWIILIFSALTAFGYVMGIHLIRFLHIYVAYGLIGLLLAIEGEQDNN